MSISLDGIGRRGLGGIGGKVFEEGGVLREESIEEGQSM